MTVAAPSANKLVSEHKMVRLIEERIKQEYNDEDYSTSQHCADYRAAVLEALDGCVLINTALADINTLWQDQWNKLGISNYVAARALELLRYARRLVIAQNAAIAARNDFDHAIGGMTT